MDIQCIGIVTLLRSALKNEAGTIPEGFDWEKARKVLYEHHLTAIAVRGAARCGVPRTEPALQKMKIQFCQDIAVSRLQMQQLSAVYEQFEKHGIQYMPIKGAVLKSMYPQPELRMMGDADIMIHQEQYPQIREALLSLGLQEKLIRDHECTWCNGDFKLELHRRLIPSYNKDYYSYYGDGWHLAQPNEQGSACYMGAEDHFIYLLVHFAKHYRDGTISAKNLCDFWVWRRVYPDMNEAYLQEQLQKLKLLDFYKNILDLLDVWFEGATPTEAVEILTHTAFQGGIYNVEESEIASYLLKRSVEGNSLSEGRGKWFLRKVFPAAIALHRRYPVLKKYPVLLPVIWVWRWFELAFIRRDRVREVTQNARKADDSRITYYKEQLQAVGLSFNRAE